ncbi:MAG: zinc-ribbon and DUF3426 domain-containing protein [Burkholderiales bacterium]|nr:zinc-ribbon and DUF3426 domain-containing protein [Burkholderiales bacterium]
MSLVTRCPDCDTTFRVQAAQLSARGGRVRCGKCGRIFDGLAQIVEDEAAAPHVGPSPQLPLFDPSRLAAETRSAASAPRADAQAAPAAAPVRRTRRPTTPAPDEAAFLAIPRRRGRFVVLWSLFALIALFVLALQAAVHYRTELILHFPQVRPHFERACDVLGCEVHLPRQPDLIGIESSELRFDKAREGVIRLTALVRNRAAFPQEFPALELTLTDEDDQPVVRRVLTPPEYLGTKDAETRLARGIAAGAEEVIRIELELEGLRAAGFRLYLFYPETAP